MPDAADVRLAMRLLVLEDETLPLERAKQEFLQRVPKIWSRLHAPVVPKVHNTIHQIILYPVDNAVGLLNTYPLDSDLSRGE